MDFSDPAIQIIFIAILFVILLIIFVLSLVLNWHNALKLTLLVIVIFYYIRYNVHISMAWVVIRTAVQLPAKTMTERIKLTQKMTRDIFGKIIPVDTNFSYPKVPVIYMSNYRKSILEYLHALSFEKTKLLSKSTRQFGLSGSLLRLAYHPDYNQIEVLPEGGSYNDVEEKICSAVNAGYSVFAYPERNGHGIAPRPKCGLIDFRLGLFRIAHKHNIPIVPLINDYIGKAHLFGTDKYKQRIGNIIWPHGFTTPEALCDHVKQSMMEIIISSFC